MYFFINILKTKIKKVVHSTTLIVYKIVMKVLAKIIALLIKRFPYLAVTLKSKYGIMEVNSLNNQWVYLSPKASLIYTQLKQAASAKDKSI